MDVITASVGSPGGWSTNAWAEIASRLVDEGVVVTIANGNSGEAGAFFGSTGSSGTNVLAVASVETETYPASPFELTSMTVDGVAETVKVRRSHPRFPTSTGIAWFPFTKPCER